MAEDVTQYGHIEPMDDHNTTLVEHVHPPDWENPTPTERYNLVVIGAGTAGLVTAAGGAGLGGKVALIERHLMGGDCLNVGCVPSKALLAAAKVAHTVRTASEYGVHVTGEVTVDFGRVMERMRELRAEIAPVDGAPRFSGDLGVDVYMGQAKFVSADCIEVGGQRLDFKQAVIATGGRAAVPPIPGLLEAGYLTNDSLFELTELPQSMAVIGAGPIGCEMAQAFARFGAEVTLLGRGPEILPREDPEAAAVVRAAPEADGVQVLTEASATIVTVEGDDKVLTLEDGRVISAKAILVAAGRAPNVQGLGLEEAGVEYDERKGITVDSRLQTTNRNVFAIGDVAIAAKFTHAAEFSARIVIQNALFMGRKHIEDLIMPWCTYTEPELAHVGMTLDEAAKKGVELDTFMHTFAHVDRAILEGTTQGFIKVHVKAGSDKIVGATIVGPHAGDLISQITQLMTTGQGLGAITGVIHPYPTLADGVRQVGNAYNRTRLTPRVAGAFEKWLSWRRR